VGSSIVRYGRVFFAGTCLSMLVLLNSGCSARRRVYEPRAVVEDVTVPIEHIIRYPGENLGLVSAWYTGKASNWEAIADANPGLDPNRLRVGDLIIIPAELVIRSQELPAERVEEMLAEGLRDFSAQVGASVGDGSVKTGESLGSKDVGKLPGSSESSFPVGRPEPKIELQKEAVAKGGSEGVGQKEERGTLDESGTDLKGSSDSDPKVAVESTSQSVSIPERRPSPPPPSRFKTQEEMLRELLAE
jgi:hypothetical protein